MTDIAKIRARHEALDIEDQDSSSWDVYLRMHEAHADRAVLLARVAELEGALKPFAEARLESWGQRTQGVGDYLTKVWINTAPNIAFSNARAALGEKP